MQGWTNGHIGAVTQVGLRGEKEGGEACQSRVGRQAAHARRAQAGVTAGRQHMHSGRRQVCRQAGKQCAVQDDSAPAHCRLAVITGWLVGPACPGSVEKTRPATATSLYLAGQAHSTLPQVTWG